MADVAVRAAGTSSTSGTSSGGFRGWATRQRSWRRQRANTSAGAMPLEELVNNVSFAATCSIDSNSFCFAMTSSGMASITQRSEEHTSELQSRLHLVCRLLLEKKKKELQQTDEP